MLYMLSFRRMKMDLNRKSFQVKPIYTINTYLICVFILIAHFPHYTLSNNTKLKYKKNRLNLFCEEI